MRRTAARSRLAISLIAAVSASGCSSAEESSTFTVDTLHPGHIRACPKGSGEDGFDTANLLGLQLEEAEKLAQAHGCSIRLYKLDGKWFDVTTDLNPNRINVAVRNGTITEIFPIG